MILYDSLWFSMILCVSLWFSVFLYDVWGGPVSYLSGDAEDAPDAEGSDHGGYPGHGGGDVGVFEYDADVGADDDEEVKQVPPLFEVQLPEAGDL